MDGISAKNLGHSSTTMPVRWIINGLIKEQSNEETWRALYKIMTFLFTATLCKIILAKGPSISLTEGPLPSMLSGGVTFQVCWVNGLVRGVRVSWLDVLIEAIVAHRDSVSSSISLSYCSRAATFWFDALSLLHHLDNSFFWSLESLWYSFLA